MKAAGIIVAGAAVAAVLLVGGVALAAPPKREVVPPPPPDRPPTIAEDVISLGTLGVKAAASALKTDAGAGLGFAGATLGTLGLGVAAPLYAFAPTRGIVTGTGSVVKKVWNWLT